jgi:hypothetical protein
MEALSLSQNPLMNRLLAELPGDTEPSMEGRYGCFLESGLCATTSSAPSQMASAFLDCVGAVTPLTGSEPRRVFHLTTSLANTR